MTLPTIKIVHKLQEIRLYYIIRLISDIDCNDFPVTFSPHDVKFPSLLNRQPEISDRVGGGEKLSGGKEKTGGKVLRLRRGEKSKK